MSTLSVLVAGTAIVVGLTAWTQTPPGSLWERSRWRDRSRIRNAVTAATWAVGILAWLTYLGVLS